MDSLFSTHPDTANRIAALQAMTDISGARPIGRQPARHDAVADDTAPGPWSRGADRRPPNGSGQRKGPWG